MSESKWAKNKRIWKRMGFELAILDGWISAIQSDPEYIEVTDRRTSERWREITARLDTIRSMNESRAAGRAYNWNSEYFFPENCNAAMIEQIVKRLRRSIKHLDLDTTEAQG